MLVKNVYLIDGGVAGVTNLLQMPNVILDSRKADVGVHSGGVRCRKYLLFNRVLCSRIVMEVSVLSCY
jgi:hypothetical protein